MCHLPQEIIEIIVSYFLYLDAWVNDEIDWSAFIRGGRLPKSQPVPLTLKLDYDTIFNLRLVSRDWHACASLLLRNYHQWRFNFDSEASVQNAKAYCDGVVHSTSRSLVRELKISAGWDVLSTERWYDWAGRAASDWENWDEETQMTFKRQSYVETPIHHGHHSSPKAHYDKTFEHQVFCHLLDCIDGVESLSILFPSATAYCRSRTRMAQCYDMRALQQMHTSFRYGFQTNAFAHIVHLRLDLPSTRDVGEIADSLNQDARDRLKHLHIKIMDETGCAGSQEFLAWTGLVEDSCDGTTNDDSFRGENDYPVSNLQWQYPNREHQSMLWNFASSCPNLESLGIEATHYLDLCQLQTFMSQGLRVLRLSRLYITAPAFIALCRGESSNALPRLQYLNLKDIKIFGDGGTWSQVFSFLLNECTDLDFINFELLTYFTDHEHYMEFDYPDDGPLIRSLADEIDISALKQLIQRLVDKVGGLEFCTTYLQWMAEELRLGEEASNNSLVPISNP